MMWQAQRRVWQFVVGLMLLSMSPALSQDLPRLLSDDDVAAYQAVFELQEAGDIKKASRIIRQIENPLLMGHVLSQKYLHPTAWRSSFTELSSWLAEYHDHPAASRISWLAKKRKPANAATPKAPKKGYLNGIGHSEPHSYRARIPATTKGRISPTQTRRIASKVRRYIRSRAPTAGNQYLSDRETLRYLTKFEEAQLRGELAHAYLIFGLDDKAIRTARHAIGVGRDKAWMGYWSGGLAAWRSQQYGLAHSFFTTLAELENAPDKLRAGAAFWSYRSAMRQKQPAEALRYLDIALTLPHTFYGILAMQVSGQDHKIDFSLVADTAPFLSWLLERPGGQRTVALLQIGNEHEAAREMRYLYKETPKHLIRHFIRFALDHNLADVAFRAADYHRYETGESLYAGLYPALRLEGDFDIDEALVFSIIRKESGFATKAKSRAAATGIMQIMPATAAFIMQDRSLRTSNRHKLYDKNFNIALGQKYIRHLIDEPHIGFALDRMLAAYNGGPGNLNKWLRSIDHRDDPLLFIESIPARETRIYVKSVIANLWMYRQQFEQDTPAVRRLATAMPEDMQQAFLQPKRRVAQ